MIRKNNPPPPSKFLITGFHIPEYQGEIPQFDPDDIIEGEEACAAYDEERRKEREAEEKKTQEGQL